VRFETERGGPFLLELTEGDVRVLPSPADLVEDDLEALVSLNYWLDVCDLGDLPWGHAGQVWERWKAHHGVPNPPTCTRLRFLVDRYADELEVDFARHYVGIDPAELWQARRWRYLLNLIDHLPRNSYYSQAVMNDPEHMAMLERVKSRGGSGPKPLPPLATWSPEVDMGATINDSLLALKDALIRSNVPKDKQNSIPEIVWTPRPGVQSKPERSQIAREEAEARHKRAVSLFLPQSADSDD
jgi:hypothetical protein